MGARDDEADAQAVALEKAERERLRLMLCRDLEKLAAMLDDELVYTHSSGVTHNRAEYLALMATSNLVYEDISVQPSVRLVAGAGVVHARMSARIRMNGQQRTLNGSYLAIWRQRTGTWLLCALQSTPGPAAG